jgi:hypothetical protein
MRYFYSLYKNKPMKLFKVTLLCLLFVTGGNLLSAQTADEIVEKYVKAIGGREKLNAIKTVKITGKMSAQGMDMPFVSYIRRPNSIRMEITVQGMAIINAYDSKTKSGWYISPMGGDKSPQKMNPEQTTDMGQSAEEQICSPLVNYKAEGATIELIGKEDLEGVEVYKIMMTKKNKDVVYYSIDASTFLILKEASKIKFQDKEIEAESFYSNYKTFGGITFPCTMEAKEGGQLQTQFSTDKIEVDAVLDDALFVMPPTDVKDQKAEPAKSGGN